MAQNEVSFFYGQNLSSNVPFKPGAIYFDTLKKQIYYDNPSQSEGSHDRIASLGSYTEVNALPTFGNHGDIVVLKTLIKDNQYLRTPYVYNEESSSWIRLIENINVTQIYFGQDFDSYGISGDNLLDVLANIVDALNKKVQIIRWEEAD